MGEATGGVMTRGDYARAWFSLAKHKYHAALMEIAAYQQQRVSH